jgi:hypothetical protein
VYLRDVIGRNPENRDKVEEEVTLKLKYEYLCGRQNKDRAGATDNEWGKRRWELGKGGVIGVME